MSHDSNFPDKDIAQEPSVEPPAEAPSGPPPPVSPPAGDDSNMTETSTVSTPSVPPEAPSTQASTSTVGGFYASVSSESQSFAHEPTGTSPSESSSAQVSIYSPQAQQYQNQQAQAQQPWAVTQVKARNPLLYALVDFLITGLGLIVQGRVGLGLLFLGTNVVASLLLIIPILGWILFFLILLPVWIISMAMAFSTAKRWNRQHGIIS